MTAVPQQEKSSRSWIFLVVRWAAALVILGILFYLLPVAPLRSALARVSFTRFIAVLLIYVVAVTGGITKWHTVVNAAGAQLNFATSAQCYTSGLFGALFLPSIIGGDVARLAVGISRSPRPAAVVTGNVADRFLDVAAQLTLVSLGLILLPGSLPVPLPTVARPLYSNPAQARATASCASRDLTPSLATGLWLVVGNLRAGYLCCAYRSAGYCLWTPSSVPGVALCVATGKNSRCDAHHARRHWSSRSSAGRAARALWRAGAASIGYGHRLGGRDHHRRPSRGINGVSLAVRAKPPARPLAFPTLPRKSA